ncbi:MAG: hypothetical protein EOP04_09845 [Proteobacteria bacterium]|nr:MAG: hypothetical protein EOP04_09845 [Pseudomonadota bacterium]
MQGISGHLKITVPFADTISLSLAFDDFRRQLVAITDKIYFYRFGSDQPYLEESIEALRGKAYTFLSKGRMITGMENMFNVHELYERLMPEIRAVSYDIADMNRLLILPSAMFKDGRAYNKAKRWLAYPDRDTDSIQIIDQFGAHYGSIAIKPGEIVTALAFTPDGNGLWIATYGSGSLVRIAFYELHDLKNARLSKAYDDIGHISQFIPIKGSSPKAYILYLGSGQEMTLLGMDGVRQAIDVSAFEIQSEPQVLDGLDLTIIGELKTQARNIVALDLEGTVKVLPVSPTSDNRYRVYPSMDQKSYWFCGVATSRCDRFKLGSDDLSLTIESDSNMPWSLKKMASYDALDDRGLSFMHFQDGRLLFLKKNPGDGTILKRQEYADIASYGKISETYWYALTRDANLLVLSMADGSRRFEYKLPVVKSLLCSNDEASFGSKRFCPDFKVHFDKDNEIINVFYTETNSSLAFRFKQLLLRPDALIERMESWEQR